jgi:hypothetical protein
MERFLFSTGDLPPQFEGQPFVFLLTVFALLLITLLGAEWLWRLSWSIGERPVHWKSPASALRWLLIFLLLSVVMRVGPNVVQLMSWSVSTPAQRLALYRVDNLLDGLSFIPFALGWLVAFLGGPMITFQLAKEPLPLHLWPTFQQMKRPLKIGAGVFAIAFALAYLQ